MTAQDENVDLDSEEFQELKKEKTKELKPDRGPVVIVWQWLQRAFSLGLPLETFDDWLAVKLLTQKITRNKKQLNREDLESLATVAACLELARKSRVLSEAWSYINRAGAYLSEVADNNDDLDALGTRMKTLQPALNRLIEELQLIPDTNVPPLEDSALKKKVNRLENPKKETFIYLSAQAQKWHLVNQNIDLSIRLWRFSRRALTVLIIIALVVAGLTQGNLKYLYFVLLGLFGAGLSSALSTRQKKVTAITYQQNREQIAIRLLLGAAGAFVLYAIAQIPGFWAELNTVLKNESPAFIALGVAAGFSERLFINALELFASKLPFSGKDAEKPAKGAKKRDEPRMKPKDKHRHQDRKAE